MYQKLLSTLPGRFLHQVIDLYFSLRISQASACLAYFVLLTVFPLLICVSYLVSLANVDVSALLFEVQNILPAAALDIIESYLFYISYHQSEALFWAGLAGCWLSASAAYRTVSHVIHEAYDVGKGSFLRGMVISILFPLGLLLTVALSVVVVTTGQHTLSFIASHIPFLGQFFRLWVWLRYVLLFAGFFLFLVLLLGMVSPKGTPQKPILATSLVAAVALVVSSGVFSWFIGLSSRYSLVYGSLVSLIILLLWMYLCGQILFLTIIFINVWFKIRHQED